MKNLTLVILAVAALITAYLWRQEGIATAKAEARVQAFADSVEVARAAQEADSVRFEAAKSQFASDTLRLTSQLTSQRLTISRLRASGDSLERVLASDTTPSDSITTLVRVAATRLQEARTCGLALTVSDSLFDGCTGLLARSDTLLANERELRLATERLADQYRRLSKPSIFQKVAKGLPWLGVGGAIVCILKC